MTPRIPASLLVQHASYVEGSSICNKSSYNIDDHMRKKEHPAPNPKPTGGWAGHCVASALGRSGPVPPQLLLQHGFRPMSRIVIVRGHSPPATHQSLLELDASMTTRSAQVPSLHGHVGSFSCFAVACNAQAERRFVHAGGQQERDFRHAEPTLACRLY